MKDEQQLEIFRLRKENEGMRLALEAIAGMAPHTDKADGEVLALAVAVARVELEKHTAEARKGHGG